MMARFLAVIWSLLFVASNFPHSGHGLHFTNAVRVWDEALPLGLGRLHNGRLEQLKLAANNFARTPNRATEHALADEVNTLLKR